MSQERKTRLKSLQEANLNEKRFTPEQMHVLQKWHTALTLNRLHIHTTNYGAFYNISSLVQFISSCCTFHSDMRVKY